MGPVCNNNYGTFVSVEAGREGGDEKPAHPAPAFEQGPPARSGVEHRLLRDWRGKFGLQLRLNGAEVVVLTVDDDVARVRFMESLMVFGVRVVGLFGAEFQFLDGKGWLDIILGHRCCTRTCVAWDTSTPAVL